VREQLDHLGLRQHLLDPDRALELRDPCADALPDLGRVGRAGAEDELRPLVDRRGGVEQVLEPLLVRDAADEDDISR